MSLSEQKLLALFQKLLEGTLSATEMNQLRDAAHDDRDIQAMLDVLESSTERNDSDLEAELIYEKTRPNSLPQRKDEPRPKNHIKFMKWPFFMAASVLLVLCSVGITLLRHRKQDIKERWQIVQTKKGERRFFKLTDGTEIWLNNESILKVKEGYGQNHREIQLLGEAYFSVTKNEDLPLHVQTEQTTIEVLGTVFNVRAYPEDESTETALLEGKVRLKVAGTTKVDYTLVPGDKVLVSQKNNIKENQGKKELTPLVGLQVEYKKMDLKLKNAEDYRWIDNKLVFNADPLPVMVTKLSRWYNKVIILESEDLKNEVFSGVFDEKECEQVLDVLRKTGANLQYKTKQDTIYIK